MRTAIMQETDFALRGLKQHQILGEDANKLSRVVRRQIRRNSDRMPIAAQQLARRRSRTNARQHLIFFRSQHLWLLPNKSNRRNDSAILYPLLSSIFISSTPDSAPDARGKSLFFLSLTQASPSRPPTSPRPSARREIPAGSLRPRRIVLRPPLPGLGFPQATQSLVVRFRRRYAVHPASGEYRLFRS